MKKNARPAAFVLVIVSLLVLFDCTSEPKKPAEEAASKPAEPTLYTGREAIYKMYVAARSWQADALPFRLESQPTKDVTGKDGRYAVWRASFGSPGHRVAKTYSWSGIKEDDAPDPGISFGAEDSYNPSNTSTRTFDLAFFKVDSDKAVEVASQHGGEKLLKQNASLPLICVVEWSAQENKLMWHVEYGGTGNEAKLRVLVDATTGEFLKVEK
ncbi:MAG TPA: PepSY domain-containing protein [Terriglobales bacterium]|nr:PepSY domain-containing protein [Terriglobales bacterium]